MATRFDAAGDYFYRTASAPQQWPLTIDFWLYLTVDRNAYNTLFIIANAAGTSYISFNLSGTGTNLSINVNGNTTSGSNLSLGVWYHITCQILSATSQRMYLDEVLDIDKTSISTTFTPAQYFIGSDTVGFLNGRLGNLKIIEQALTVPEMTTERSDMRPLNYRAWAWYPMFAGASERVLDYSGNGRNLTAAGTLADEDGPPVGWNDIWWLPTIAPVSSGAIIGRAAGISVGNATFAGSGRLVGQCASVAANRSNLAGTTSISGRPVGYSVSLSALAGNANAIGRLWGTSIGAGDRQAIGVGTGRLISGGIGSGTLAGTGALVGDMSTAAVNWAVLSGLFSFVGQGFGNNSLHGELLATGTLAGLSGAVSDEYGQLSADGALKGIDSCVGVTVSGVTAYAVCDGLSAGSGIISADGQGIANAVGKGWGNEWDYAGSAATAILLGTGVSVAALVGGLSGAGQLAGQSVETSNGTAEADGLAALICACWGTSVEYSIPSAAGSLSGQGFSNTGDVGGLAGDGSLLGQSAESSNGVADLTGVAPISSDQGITFGVSWEWAEPSATGQLSGQSGATGIDQGRLTAQAGLVGVTDGCGETWLAALAQGQLAGRTIGVGVEWSDLEAAGRLVGVTRTAGAGYLDTGVSVGLGGGTWQLLSPNVHVYQGV